MTATTLSDRPVRPGQYGLGGLVRAEWTKLRTVRSTMWTLGLTVVLGIGIAALATSETRQHWTPADRVGFDPVSLSLVGSFVGEFTLGVLGVLVMSSEYSTGTIRATLSAAPRRLGVLVAKALVFGAVAFLVAELVAFVSFFLGQALLGPPAIHATISSPGALRAVVGVGVYLLLLGFLALGLATIIRHTAGAISTYFGILLVLPLIVRAFPGSVYVHVEPYLPDRIGANVISQQLAGPNDLAWWAGLLVLAGYAAAALVAGGLLLLRRDA